MIEGLGNEKHTKHTSLENPTEKEETVNSLLSRLDINNDDRMSCKIVKRKEKSNNRHAEGRASKKKC